MVDVRTGCPDAQLEPPEDNSPIVGECCMCGHEIRGWEKHFILSAAQLIRVILQSLQMMTVTFRFKRDRSAS